MGSQAGEKWRTGSGSESGPAGRQENGMDVLSHVARPKRAPHKLVHKKQIRKASGQRN